jgi:class 3 adenylate cyclase
MPRGALPTGSVTFLITDVVGSTRLWEEKREFMRTALPRHDALAEGIAEQHHGMIVRCRGEGDSLFIVFTSAAQAIAAAIDLQRSRRAVSANSVQISGPARGSGVP